MLPADVVRDWFRFLGVWCRGCSDDVMVIYTTVSNFLELISNIVITGMVPVMFW